MPRLFELAERMAVKRARLESLAEGMAAQSRIAPPEPMVPPTINVNYRDLVLQPQSVQIIVQQQDVQVALAPAISVQSPQVLVEPQIHVASPSVHVEAPNVSVNPVIEVESPTVNVAAPNVTVKPNIVVESPAKRIEFTRDGNGLIKGAVSTPK